MSLLSAKQQCENTEGRHQPKTANHLTLHTFDMMYVLRNVGHCVSVIVWFSGSFIDCVCLYTLLTFDVLFTCSLGHRVIAPLTSVSMALTRDCTPTGKETDARSQSTVDSTYSQFFSVVRCLVLSLECLDTVGWDQERHYILSAKVFATTVSISSIQKTCGRCSPV